MLRRTLVTNWVFSPANVPGLQLWLSSRYSTSMLQERSSATTLASANGDPIGTWLDLSGNGRHVTASTDARRPTLGTNAKNGLPGVVFDGTDDGLNIPSFNYTADFTIFAVVKYTFSTGTPTICHAQTGVGASMYQFRFNSSTSLQAIAFNTVPSAFTSNQLTTVNSDVFNVVGMKVGANQVISYSNGTAGSAVNITGTQNSGSTTGEIGIRLNANSLNGTICELLQYDSALTDAQRIQIQRYLGAQWGITVA